MKRLTGITWAFCLLPLIWSGCYNLGPCVNGQGDVVTTEIELDPFDRIDLASAGEVFITQGSTQRITVESNPNVIERLNKSVNSGEWFIGFKSCINYRTLKIYIEVPKIESIVLSGSGNIVSGPGFVTDNAHVLLSGSGNLTAEFETVNMTTELSGSGNINLSGSTVNHTLRIGGSGSIGSFNLMSENCIIDIPGSGNADVSVSQTLNVTISGSGSVRYQGDPALTERITGSGTVSKVN